MSRLARAYSLQSCVCLLLAGSASSAGPDNIVWVWVVAEDRPGSRLTAGAVLHSGYAIRHAACCNAAVLQPVGLL